MNSLTSRVLGSSARASLLVAVAGAAFALTPQPASSTVKVCLTGHGCITLGNSCGFWSVPEPYVCFTMGLALTNPRLIRDRVGGAVLVNDGQSSPIASDAAELLLTNWAARRKSEGVDRPLTEAMRREFDSGFRSNDRRVSDRRLQSISRELGLPIEDNAPSGGSAVERVDLSEVSRASENVSRFLAQPELAEALTNLRADPRAAEEASRDPRGYLTRRGVEVDRSIEVQIKPPTDGGTASRSAVDITIHSSPNRVIVVIIIAL
jgi:hypothetical protein